MSEIFEDRTARRRLDAANIVARIDRNQELMRMQKTAIAIAERNHRQRMIRETAIALENAQRFHRAMIRNGVLFILAAVSLFSLIWWCGL
ncbi:MAG: hypothetical protein IPK63_16040 [Candidatus Competibacteraceae bacterium]|nr:hypothetical protein [Candidatus Competibacteraceae bacterium]